MGNVKSVIDVEINDKPFAEFQAKFNAYRDALKKMPGEWGKTGEATKDVSHNFETMTAFLLAQNELLAKNLIQHNNAAKATKSMASDFSSISKSVTTVTGNLIKWGGLGFGVATGAFAGLAALGFAAGNQRRASQGLGVTTAEQAGLNLQFGRYFDVNSNLENIANAKSDYSQRWAFGAMGINPDGKDPAQLAVDMAVRAKSLFEKGGQTQQGAQAYGLLQFYTMDDLRRLHESSVQELQDSKRKYQDDAKRLKRQDEINKKWQDFGVALKESGQVIENVLIKRLANLADPLDKFSKSVASTIDHFMENKDFGKWLDQAATGIDKFATYIGTPEFQTKVKNFASDVVDFADAVHSGLMKLGVLKDHTNDPADLPKMGKDAALSTMKYFEGKEWTQAGAAAIAEQFSAESKFNPFAQGDKNKNGVYEAYGMGQWHPDRQKVYAQIFGHTMQSVRDVNQARSEQTVFADYELEVGKYKKWGDLIKHTTDPKYAGYLASRYYESPKEGYWTREVSNKRANDTAAMIIIQNNTGGSASVTTSQIAR